MLDVTLSDDIQSATRGALEFLLQMVRFVHVHVVGERFSPFEHASTGVAREAFQRPLAVYSVQMLSELLFCRQYCLVAQTAEEILLDRGL